MTWEMLPPLVILFSSFLPGLVIFFLPDERAVLRTTLNMAGAVLKLVMIGAMLWGVWRGMRFEVAFEIVPGVNFVLHTDALSMLFISLSGVLWFLTTIYAIGYFRNSPNRSRFFGFFSICVSATTGIAMSGNLFTLFLFYEMLTFSTYPLVVHRGSEAALRAGRIYLAYTLTGGAVVLAGLAWLTVLAGPVDFVERGGALSHVGPGNEAALVAIFALLIGGFGVKAALVPLHGWLPIAMVAPAPVSALLHAVAVVKAGAFGILRVIYDIYGIDKAAELGVLQPLAVLAAATILWGSLRALAQMDLKRRLAFSTVSQLSYIVLGASLLGPAATIGALVHVIHQGVMKVTMFFCAGNLAETLGIHRIDEMKGVGRRMPLTMGAFTLAALGMMAAPPMAGFITKWYLGLGALEAGQGWALGVLLISSLLNAAYFLPILRTAWFDKPEEGVWQEHLPRGRWETSRALLFPPLVTAGLALLFGLFAGSPLSPLSWATLIAALEYVAP
ncbi:proton-conducting transporter membrane subunit [Telmatospirillum sp. J64-1]|uniref:proton-conducting transporter transmembrane domain-containing protein n=1 Tax=Telmatospirillum sp. J64-1 TaxID=2502183 RepID=UPI00115F3D21|nr:proton-conducting transporter membrane subunit [Telmatospirillum sp. J64-1]